MKNPLTRQQVRTIAAAFRRALQAQLTIFEADRVIEETLKEDVDGLNSVLERWAINSGRPGEVDAITDEQIIKQIERLICKPTFTAIVAGSERHDGHAPYAYVLHATDKEDAGQKALMHHRNETGDDVILVSVEEGLPKDSGYWNDLREAPISL